MSQHLNAINLGQATSARVLRPWRAERWSDWLAGLAFTIIVADILLSTVLGIVAVAVWPALPVLGSGPGGGNGVPMLALFAATVLGIPSLLVGVAGMLCGRRHAAARLLAFVGPCIIMLSFFFVSHAFDPCVRGWVSPRSTVAGIALCEPYLAIFNIHTRLHLLHHALVPTLLLGALYAVSLRRWHPAWRSSL